MNPHVEDTNGISIPEHARSRASGGRRGMLWERVIHQRPLFKAVKLLEGIHVCKDRGHCHAGLIYDA